MRKILALLMALTLGFTAGCSRQAGELPEQKAASYTFKTYTTALGSNWNPHTWETNADSGVNDYITSPLVSVSVLDGEAGVYQWIYEMASSITDVTALCRDDLTKYAVVLPEGQTAEETDEGYVYEIALNPEARWQNGEPITADDYIYSMEQLLSPRMHNYRANLYIAGEAALAGAKEYYYSDGSIPFETVGCYKVDDYRIRYVCRTYLQLEYFLSSCTKNWLVYRDLYEEGKDTSGELVTTDYGTSIQTTMAYGPYKLYAMQPDRQMIFLQNENWYGWERQPDGSLIALTPYEVDGSPRQRYQTTRIVVDVLEETTAKQAFLKGELSAWTPPAEELSAYGLSDRLYRSEETYTMSLFFNSDRGALEEMDRSKGNTNSLVLSSETFRKAMSLAIDRAEFVSATPGYKSAYTLMNDLYFYDIYRDPKSSYRGSEPAMEAICRLYGVEYGEGKAYATVEEASASVSGYNLAQAKVLMKQACEELSAAGDYTPGQPVVIRVAWAKGALSPSDSQQVSLLNRFLNRAAEESGFGTITLEAVGNLSDRYGDVTRGEYAVGYGAWGGAAFYPFRNMQLYCDPDQYALHEGACWDPTAEELTLSVRGEEVTMTWQDWSNALMGTGRYAAADNRLKLEITALLEQKFLEKYYRIPLCSTTVGQLLSYQVDYYTDDYNVMYGFGGLELMEFYYDDDEWKAFVSSQGGILSYE